ncbi:MAG: fumarate reductase cytochrome subunit b [Epsilonproteobacteria bacterium]|nr:MAG: fumarate reductase cytochrome subunit b [Campylobacterota bacterium]
MKNKNYIIEGLIDRQVDGKKSKIPARLDFFQSLSGLVLGLFMWVHMALVSSILVSKDFMYKVTKLLEGSWLIDGGHPAFVSVSVAVIFAIFVLHAFLAIRKFPNSYRQYRNFKAHMLMFAHDETKLWFMQAITGFALFFLGSVHLYIMLTNPADIGPYMSSNRVVEQLMWPLYILLLIAVELHGTIGLYKLSVKWGWFEGDDVKLTRVRLKKIKWFITSFFLLLGILSLLAYVKIGLEHNEGRYIPSGEIK